MCLRSGINRLRLRAEEQKSLAHTASGPTASLAAAIALATAAQARAGAGHLAGKLARLLACNVSSLVPPQGLPRWQLLLDAAYKAPKADLATPVHVKEEQLQPEQQQVSEIIYPLGRARGFHPVPCTT